MARRTVAATDKRGFIQLRGGGGHSYGHNTSRGARRVRSATAPLPPRHFEEAVAHTNGAWSAASAQRLCGKALRRPRPLRRRRCVRLSAMCGVAGTAVHCHHSARPRLEARSTARPELVEHVVLSLVGSSERHTSLHYGDDETNPKV